MEGGKQTGSSLASDLFGAKDSHKSGSASGVFGSLFDSPSKVMGRGSLHLPKFDKKAKNEFGNHPDENGTGSEGQSYEPRMASGSYYHQEQKAPPFHYNSSIYYGGQDVYSRPQDTQSTVFTTFKDGAEDDSSGASRGNWWRGSYHY